MKRGWVRLGIFMAVCHALWPATLKAPHVKSTRHSFGINLRRRVNTQPLIVDPGTMELDWNFLVSNHANDFSMPTTLRITPEGKHVFWGRSEFAVNLDSLESTGTATGRVNHFTDRVNLTMTSVLVDGARFSLAGGPQITTFVRGDHGLRAGAFLIARTDWGHNAMGFTLNWTGATAPSDTNPAGTLDAGFGGGRRLGSSGLAGVLTVHGNYSFERSTGMTGFHSLFEGLEIELNDRVALDLSAQHVGLGSGGGAVDNQFLAGLSINLGRYHK